jgi:hypothetical protein
VTATGIGAAPASSAAVNVPALPPPPHGVASVARQTDTVSKKGSTAITVTCSPAGPCTGLLVVSLTTQGGKAVGAAAKRKRTTIGKQSFSLAAGQRGPVVVKLTKQGRRLVAKARHGLTVTLTIGAVSARATLKAAK